MSLSSTITTSIAQLTSSSPAEGSLYSARKLAWEALPEERREIVAIFTHRGDRTEVIQRDGDDGSPLNFSENDEPEPFGLDSDVPKKGKDVDTAEEKNELKKATEKEEGPKKERGTRGRSVRVKK